MRGLPRLRNRQGLYEGFLIRTRGAPSSRSSTRRPSEVPGADVSDCLDGLDRFARCARAKQSDADAAPSVRQVGRRLDEGAPDGLGRLRVLARDEALASTPLG